MNNKKLGRIAQIIGLAGLAGSLLLAWYNWEAYIYIPEIPLVTLTSSFILIIIGGAIRQITEQKEA